MTLVCMGGVPVTEQDSLKPFNARTVEPGTMTFGAAIEIKGLRRLHNQF